MHPCKQAGLACYYHASRPYRACRNAISKRRGMFPLIVLFYHRVADCHPNAWTIGTRQFARHIAWLAGRFEMISLDEVQRRVAAGYNQRPAVAITFDDGYAENCDFALPLLLEKGIPVTYFVCTGHVARGRPFPHDVDAGHPLPPNSISQLRTMAKDGIEIGAHTRWHVDLGQAIEPARTRDEICTAAEELAELVQAPVNHFAFPYGQPHNLSASAYRLIHAAGFRSISSAYGAYNLPGGDAYHIRRIHGDPGLLRLANWCTIDPRKLRERQGLDAPEGAAPSAGAPLAAAALPAAEISAGTAEAKTVSPDQGNTDAANARAVPAEQQAAEQQVAGDAAADCGRLSAGRSGHRVGR